LSPRPASSGPYIHPPPASPTLEPDPWRRNSAAQIPTFQQKRASYLEAISDPRLDAQPAWNATAVSVRPAIDDSDIDAGRGDEIMSDVYDSFEADSHEATTAATEPDSVEMRDLEAALR